MKPTPLLCLAALAACHPRLKPTLATSFDPKYVETRAGCAWYRLPGDEWTASYQMRECDGIWQYVYPEDSAAINAPRPR